MRAFCHCSLCKKFNNKEYADIRVFKRSDLIEFPKGNVDYIQLKSNGIFRGTCHECKEPAIEVLKVPLLPQFVIVPDNMLHGSSKDPSDLHIYYESRESDAEDNIPKYKSHIVSQFNFGFKLLIRLLTRGIN